MVGDAEGVGAPVGLGVGVDAVFGTAVLAGGVAVGVGFVAGAVAVCGFRGAARAGVVVGG